ncbi:hypothetical protein L226DRAFT_583193 [Lentinus tigrinus ALCF2SS1-7]|uniref:uncharacterized protein n=1 Tax=Lentinus tigrinus ALCF2SS1-7 TaxID=1328758 RepID=UPI0011660756|nr:hypothetical protein L226DRAFT_583193 [Lentinus tigrinus ALCF2SS1-7]
MLIALPQVAALNQRTKYKCRCPGFSFEGASSDGSSNPTCLENAAGVCCYTRNTLSTLEHSSQGTHADLGYAELFIVVSGDPSRDYFQDPPSLHDGETPSSRHLRTRTADKDKASQLTYAFGEHIACVVEVFARQHRAFVFSISVFGSLTRLFRWDRSGCVVTESFDIREHPDLLCEFLWRVSQGSPTVRGHDLTVELAPPDDEDRFREAVRAHVQSQLEVMGQELDEAVAVHYAPGQVFAMHVLPQHFTVDPENIRRFIVSRPVVTPSSLIGRGTRGYWALDASTGGIVFIKDTWRFRNVDELEGDTLRRLVDLGVRNVPHMVWHGDIPYSFPTEARRLNRKELQFTTTHLLVAEPWVCQGDVEDLHISRRQHYRLVTSVAGYSLRCVRGAEELLHATHDILVAMRDALAKDSRIHRDLSVSNIILVKHPDRTIRQGYLIDWEVSCVVDESGEAYASGRAGTWAFTSIRMLDVEREDGNKHRFEDDMESLLYVVLYCALLWQPHNLGQEELTRIIREMFDQVAVYLGSIEGGGGKSANALFRAHTRRLNLNSASLQEWLAAVMDFHSPAREPHPDDADRWTAEHLDTYWTTFLQTHTLERDNRVVHTLLPTEYRSYTPSAYTSHEPLPTPPAGIVQPAPQPEGDRQDLLAPEALKRRLRSSDAHALRAGSKRERASASPDPPVDAASLRRSKRILEQKQSKPVLAAPSSAKPSSSTKKGPKRRRSHK